MASLPGSALCRVDRRVRDDSPAARRQRFIDVRLRALIDVEADAAAVALERDPAGRGSR